MGIWLKAVSSTHASLNTKLLLNFPTRLVTSSLLVSHQVSGCRQNADGFPARVQYVWPLQLSVGSLFPADTSWAWPSLSEFLSAFWCSEHSQTLPSSSIYRSVEFSSQHLLIFPDSSCEPALRLLDHTVRFSYYSDLNSARPKPVWTIFCTHKNLGGLFRLKDTFYYSQDC